jgi:alpha-tubulin suppressor-like RCC1 family protein
MTSPYRRRSLVVLSLVAALAISLAGLVSVPATADQNESPRQRVAAASITAGLGHTCALLVSGAVRCWGSNDSGQLGLGHTNDIGDNEAITTAPTVPLGATATAVSAGARHTCALLVSGAVRCWGDNDNGQLGLGHTNDIGDNEAITTAPTVPLGAPATAISAGELHTCALLVTGAVRCWGYNFRGELGLGHTNDIGDNEAITTAPTVPLGAPATAISGGDGFTCALLSGGAVRCWGWNTSGQLGLGSTAPLGDNEAITTAAPVPLGGPASAVSAGGAHACALLAAGAVRCWGGNTNGELGLGTTAFLGDNEAILTAPTVPLGTTANAITVGGVHTCALLATSAVRCWGGNFAGQLGLGNTDKLGDNEAVTSAAPVPLGVPASAVTAGSDHTCALFSTGALRCWGQNLTGQLGLGNADAVGNDEAVTTVPAVPIGEAVRVRAATTHDLKVTKRRDRTRPYRFRLRGTVVGAFVSDTASCTGTIEVRVKALRTRGHKRVRIVRHASLRAGTVGCTYRLKVKVPRAGRYRAVAILPTTDNLIGSRDRIRLRAG